MDQEEGSGQIEPGPTGVSGVKGETECPSVHDEAYAQRNQCICGAQT